MKNNIGVYSISSPLSSIVYIGSSINLKEREKAHLSYLRKRKAPKILQAFCDEVGIDNLVFNILEICDRYNLAEREQFYISQYINQSANTRKNACRSKVAPKPTTRIYIPMSDENYDKIVKLAKEQKRDLAPMAAILLEDGLKLTEQPESAKSYQQRIADEMVKKREG